jgi:oligopeptide/dipeptide ABC transporter ATP-binding protein
LQPKVLVLDEPVSALDVSVQAQIINVLIDLQQSMDVSVLIISHDLGLVSEVCDRAVVLYSGRVMEQGAPGELVRHPRHPYTFDLVSAVPRLQPNPEFAIDIEREQVDPSRPPSGCRYRLACTNADEMCVSVAPALVSDDKPEHKYACHHPRQVPQHDTLLLQKSPSE